MKINLGGKHDDWFITRAKTIYKPKESKPWNTEVYMHLITKSRYSHRVGIFFDRQKEASTVFSNDLRERSLTSRGNVIPFVSNSENVVVPIKTASSYKFNQHSQARDNCDALAIHSLERIAATRYDKVVVTGAKWKNLQSVISTLNVAKIIAYNPDLIPGDRPT